MSSGDGMGFLEEDAVQVRQIFFVLEGRCADLTQVGELQAAHVFLDAEADQTG